MYNNNTNVDSFKDLDFFKERYSIKKTAFYPIKPYGMEIDDKIKLYHMLKEILKSELINEDYKKSFNDLINALKLEVPLQN